MTKIEITDAMVQRAVKAGYRWQGPGGYVVDDPAAHARTLLDAALNPPPKPEIEVTEEMVAAGKSVWTEQWGEGNFVRQEVVPAIYRAMRALEPKPKASIQDDPRWPFHQRASDAPQYWSPPRRRPKMTMREKIARAIFAKNQGLEDNTVPWDSCPGPMHKTCFEYADAALDALMEPTKAMMESALPYMDSFSSNGAWWEAMVTAAKDGK